MSTLKEQYTHIKFPLVGSDNAPNSVLNLYLQEFEVKNDLPIQIFVSMMLSAMRDFFEAKLTEWDIESLANAVFMTKITQQYIVPPYLWEHNKLLALIGELGDISWMKETKKPENYKNYLQEVRQKWQELVAYYTEYFKKYPSGVPPSQMKKPKKGITLYVDLNPFKAKKQ